MCSLPGTGLEGPSVWDSQQREHVTPWQINDAPLQPTTGKPPLQQAYAEQIHQPDDEHHHAYQSVDQRSQVANQNMLFWCEGISESMRKCAMVAAP